MEAQNVPLASLLGDDIKHVLAVNGLDLTGIGMTFEISAGPEQPSILTASVTLLDLLTASDGIRTSLVQVFAAAAAVRAAVAGVGGLPGNEPLPLFYQLKFDEIPGDAGTDAITTILFGDYVMKGAVYE